MKMFARFWQDEAGFVVSSELVLIATIVVLGMVAGLTEVRNGVVQELGDIGVAFGSLSQSYVFTGVSGHSSSTSGSIHTDTIDFCEVTTGPSTAGVAPGCMGVQIAQTAAGNG
jgi:Flp pilus assembly pilin Flp